MRASGAAATDLNSAEKSYCFTEVIVMPGPQARQRTEDCNEAIDAGNRAVKMANERFGKLARDGYMGNAFQHCAWNGHMTQRMNKQKARKFANLREADSDHDKHYDMDMWNNQVGRDQGSVMPNARSLYNICTWAARGTSGPTLLILKGKAKNMQ